MKRLYDLNVERPPGVPEHAHLSHTEGIPKWVWHGNEPTKWWYPPLKPLVAAVRATLFR